MGSQAQNDAASRFVPLGLLQVTSAAVLWGTVGIASKSLYSLANTDPLSIGFFRLAFAAPALLIAGRLATGDRLLRVSGRDLVRMAGIGAMMALYQATYFRCHPARGGDGDDVGSPCVLPRCSWALLGDRPAR